MKNIVLLGSTGSVGKNVLDVIRNYPDKFRISALSAGEDAVSLTAQIAEFSPDSAGIGNKELYGELKKFAGNNVEISAGPEALECLASKNNADIIFIAISGTKALKPLMAAISSGKTIALASKEPIVSAGQIIKELEKEHNAQIIPVDSEHSAIMQCLCGRTNSDIDRLYITGSGGSLCDRNANDFDNLSVEEVLDHPKWKMGRKITVDSATLMNKGLEVIEARWLFNISPEKIKVIIHPEAIIHSMVEFMDGTISASLFCPDMRFPILRALSFPEIMDSNLPRIDFDAISSFSFTRPDEVKFPALRIAFEALKEGGTVPAVMNSANEKAVNLFLDKKIKFINIIKIVESVVGKHKKVNSPSLENILDSEKWAAEEVLRSC